MVWGVRGLGGRRGKFLDSRRKLNEVISLANNTRDEPGLGRAGDCMGKEEGGRTMAVVRDV